MNPYPGWNIPSSGEGPPQSLRWGEREFWVVPKPISQPDGHSREVRTQLERYDTCKYDEFVYEPLPKSKKRIRLLQLQSGTIHGSEIHCSLIEADYDNDFHIPTTFTDAKRKEEEEKEKAWNAMSEEEQEKAEKQRLAKKHEEYDKDYHKRKAEQEKVSKMTKQERREHDRRKEVESEALEEESDKRREKEFDNVWANRIQYEALSWHWGSGPEEFAVTITQNGQKYKKRVRKELGLALKYLRMSDKPRVLWVDSICIDQNNDEERSQQVQMMSRIYTRAEQVAIWLGEDNDESKLAIDFINNEIKELDNFDTLCSDKRYSDKWRALMLLMQRHWFSRRWVVQEIALSSKATLYCGPDSVSWKALAVAVELFVEVETATHRLSEIMKKDEKFLHIPGWFDHVSELGASLLVQATGRVFRAQRTPLNEPSPEDSKQVQELRKRSILRERTIDPLDRRSLLSLEYLVSTLFIFKASEARDTVYSLLGIARDATPFAKSSFRDGDPSLLILSVMKDFLEEKPFVVDYARPYSDVCRDYVEFTIRGKCKLDPVQALDVLCRPWALDPPTGKSIRLSNKESTEEDRARRPRVLTKKAKSEEGRIKELTIVREDESAEKPNKGKGVDRQAGRQPSPSFQSGSFGTANQGSDGGDHTASGSTAGSMSPKHTSSYQTKRKYLEDPSTVKTKKDSRKIEAYWKDARWLKEMKDFGESDANWRPHPPGWDYVTWYFPERTKTITNHTNGRSDDKANPPAKLDMDRLPSWVALAAHAPFTLYSHTGMGNKAGRSHADPLVGHPQDGHRNYSAAQTSPVDLDPRLFKFRKRQRCNHYSLYVRGFELDEVDVVLDASQGGNIPKSWLDLGEWDGGDGNDYKQDPPDHFWRTLVADRGRDNRNPPYYYATACKESVQKGGIASGSVNTSALINNERNSIVAEFCRRVQAVIWSRHLFKTKRGKLGLARSVQKGDRIVILYGCTVPVIVHEVRKGSSDDIKIPASPQGKPKRGSRTSEEIIREEEFDDAVEALRSCVRNLESRLEQKARYQKCLHEFGPSYRLDIEEAIINARKEAISQLERELGIGMSDNDTDDDDVSELGDLETKGAASETKEGDTNSKAQVEGASSSGKGESQGEAEDKGERDATEKGVGREEGEGKAEGEGEGEEEGKGEGEGAFSKRKGKQREGAGFDAEKEAPREPGSPLSARKPLGRSDTAATEHRKLERIATLLDSQVGGYREDGRTPARSTTVAPSGSWGSLSKLGYILNKDPNDTKDNDIIALAKMSKKMSRRSTTASTKRYTEEPVQDKGVYYEFKGEAYVHGMMDGEALRIKLYEKLVDVLFELR